MHIWPFKRFTNECHDSQLRVHTMTMREIHASIGLGVRCVQSIVECDEMQGIVSTCDTHTLELV